MPNTYIFSILSELQRSTAQVLITYKQTKKHNKFHLILKSTCKGENTS